MFKKRTVTFIYTLLTLLYLETALRVFTVGSFDSRFIYPVIFCIPTAGLFFLLTLFWDNVILKILYNALIAFFTVFFCVQLVYYGIFGGYLSLSMVGMGGAAITNFSSQLFEALRDSAFKLLALLIPIPATIILTKTKALTFAKANWKTITASALSVVLVHALCILSLGIGGKGPFTVYDAYHTKTTATDTSVANLGVQVTAGLQLKNMIFSSFGLEKEEDVSDSLSGLVIEQEEIVIPEDSAADDNIDYGSNALNIDFDVLGDYAHENNDPITEAFYYREPTKKNKYTGMFEGYNVITLCAEGFCSYVIDKELTPTLYKMSTEGFIFENYYTSFESVTTDGEFAFCYGMLPDMARGKHASSFDQTNENTTMFTLGKVFQSLGATTFAYHSNYGTFYNRNLSHPHMGYDYFKTPDNGLDMEVDWPSSDLELMKASVDDYINLGEQFHAYYMTFSGHTQYTWDNPMAAKNRDKVDHLPYSDAVKAYLSANLELEYALQYLVERLEKAGIADKTLIVLAPDHYPYGFYDEEYSELAGKEIDTSWEKYKSTFICWSASMEAPVKVDKVCCSIDVLPTVLNLIGYDYDSRFLVGRDALSNNTPGLAIIGNYSFITDRFAFDAVNNLTIPLVDEEISDDEVQNKITFVRAMFGISRNIIYSDYYTYLESYIKDHPEVYDNDPVPEEETDDSAEMEEPTSEESAENELQ